MKQSRPRILVYDDNPDFGGHQVMAAHGMEGLVASGDFELHFWHHPDNGKWKRKLDALSTKGELQLGVTPTRTRKLQVARNFLERSPELRRRVVELDPQLVLFAQGDIEHSSLAVMELSRLGRRMASYIPMAHPYSVMKARLAFLRDLCAKPVYRAVGNWITISESIAGELRTRSPGARVLVVENGIPLQGLRAGASPEERETLRAELGLPRTGKVCALVGRIEFNQKQQDLAVESFTRHRESYKDWDMLIVGSGQDDGNLDAIIRASPEAGRIHRIPWMDNPERIYAAIDCLLLPSGYEGVPLVMLEALAAGVPVIASDIDGMRDLLPREWRFPKGSAAEMARTFATNVANDFPGLSGLSESVRGRNNLPAFQEAFVGAVRQLLA